MTKSKETLANERAEILICSTRLLDRIAVKVDCVHLGVSVDCEFLEDVCLYIEAVSQHLRDVDRDTLPPPALSIVRPHLAGCICDRCTGAP